MPLSKLNPETIETDALVGRATPVSDFNKVAIHKLNEVIDQLNNATLLGEPYVDLRLPPYNVAANDPTKATSNRTGVQAAIAANPLGAHLHFPSGLIYFNWDADDRNSLSAILFQGNGVHDFLLSGEGAFATTIVFQGDAKSGTRFGIRVEKGAERIEICNLGIRAGTITNPEPNDHNHLIQIGGDHTIGTADVYIHDCYFGQCIGDQINLLGNPSARTSRVRILTCLFHGQGIGNGSRSCIGFQRCCDNIEIGNCYLDGAKNSLIDFEPSGSTPPATPSLHHINIHDCFCDNSLGRTVVALSLGGNAGDTNTLLSDSVISSLWVNEGAVWISDCNRLDISNLNVYAIGSPGGPLDRQATAAIYVFGDVRQITFTQPQVLLDTGGRLGADFRCFLSEDHPGRGAPEQITIVGGTFAMYNNAAVVRLDSTANVHVSGTRIRGLSPAPQPNTAVVVQSTKKSISSVVFEDVVIDSPNGLLKAGIQLSAASGSDIKNVTILGLACGGQVTTAVLLTEESDSGKSGTGINDRYPVLQGINASGSTNVWLAPTNTAPIIAGNRGGGGAAWFECKQSPNTVVTAAPGSLCTHLNGDASGLFFKASGTGATTWTQITVP